MVVLRLVLVPALIGVASAVGRRWGPAVGGWFVALPLTSGPTVMIFALERGTAFAADACIGVLLGLMSLTAFTLAYAWSARWLRWPYSSALACATYLVCARTLATLSVSLPAGFLAACGLLLLALRLMPHFKCDRRRVATSHWDIPIRMALAAILVFGVTSAAGTFGPRVSGLLTPFPIAALLLTVFTHRVDGHGAVGGLLKGLLTGLFSFALFFLVVGASVHRFGTAAAFSAATVGALALQAMAWRFLSAHAGLSARLHASMDGLA